LAILIADQKITHRVLRPLSVGILFLLAALSKEMAVSLALVLPMIHLAYVQQRSLNPLNWFRALRKTNDLQVYLAIFIAGCIYLLIRHSALGYLLTPKAGVDLNRISVVSNFLLVFKSLAEYLSLMVFPFNQLTPGHPVKLPISPAEFSNWLPVIVLPIMMLATVGSLTPVINIIPVSRPEGSYFSEVYLTFPTTLWVLAIALGAIELQRYVDLKPSPFWTRTVAGVFVFWILVCVLVIRATIPIWNSDHSLWLWASTRHPDSATAQVNLSAALTLKNRFEEALAAADKAVEIDPESAYSWTARGRALNGLKRYKEAAEALEKAVVLSRGAVDQWVNLAITRTEQGYLDIARDIFLEQVLPRQPDDVYAFSNLGVVFQRKGDIKNALHYYREARKRAADPAMMNYLDNNIRTLENSTSSQSKSKRK
jgi:tetratricopeptide (TPR) repeat protein